MRYVIKRKIISIPQGTFKPNYTVVGSPTVSNGVVSGFSSGNYLKLPETFNPKSNTWEAVIKFETLSDFSAQQIILHPASSSGINVALVVDTTGKILAYASTDGSSWNILNSATGTTILSPLTSYYIKMQYTGTAYEVYLSTDGNTFNLELSVSSSSFVKGGFYLTLGAWASDERHVKSIDLNESYIKINGEYWWNCKYNEDVYDAISYVAKRKNRRYYKEHIIEWTKPTLSTNPQNGYSLSGTSYGGDIKLISNNLDGGSGYIEVQTTAAYGCLLQYDFPCVVELTNVGVNYLDQYRVNNGFSSFKLVAVLNGIETVISTEIPVRMNAWYTKNYPINNIRATSIRVYCSCPSAPWLRIGELYITGRQIDTELVSASDDYDYYEDDIKSYVIGRK